MTLSASIESILDVIVARIELETGGGDLSDVQVVVRGDRARPMPALPAVFVVPNEARMVRNAYGDDAWTLPVSVSGLVKSDDPTEGGKATQRITAVAQAIAIDCRAELRTAGVRVTDIVPTTFDATARSSEKNRTLFWTEATVSVTFTVDD